MKSKSTMWEAVDKAVSSAIDKSISDNANFRDLEVALSHVRNAMTNAHNTEELVAYISTGDLFVQQSEDYTRFMRRVVIRLRLTA